jgi:PDZ domain-containing protein
VYGPQTTGAEVAERNDQLFALSQSNSIAAAMNELGLPTDQALVVTLVSGGSPADGIVQAGDEIVAVDGQSLSNPSDVGELVRQREVGDPVVLDVLRREDPEAEPEALSLEIQTGASAYEGADAAGADDQPYVGIVVGVAYEAPFDIEFGDSNVGGPSAGMMFSLGIIDILTEGPLTDGRHVAGTGTIDPEGTVGAIGSIQQKLVGASRAGAELFLAPIDNCADVVGYIPEGLTVVPVADLAAARDTINDWVEDPGADLPQCGAELAAAERRG